MFLFALQAFGFASVYVCFLLVLVLGICVILDVLSRLFNPSSMLLPKVMLMFDDSSYVFMCCCSFGYALRWSELLFKLENSIQN